LKRNHRFTASLVRVSTAIASLALTFASNGATIHLKRYVAIKAPKPGAVAMAKAQVSGMGTVQSNNTLPLWLYGTESSRDGTFYTGVIVGKNPFFGGGKTSVPTVLVPVFIVTNSVVTDIDLNGNFAVTSGKTVFDPNAHDKTCLAAPNDVPTKLVQESPLFNNAVYSFGGTYVGTTQYVDAQQRGSFWKPIQANDGGYYHLLFDPVTRVPRTVVIDVPADEGASVPGSLFQSPLCDPLGVVDIIWLDAYLENVVIPALKQITPGTLPVFIYKNVVQSVGQPNFADCCIGGYHATTGFPIQTYAVADIDSTGVFGPEGMDTGTLSHELAEWTNDPFVNNATPPWGNIGQVIGCQGNLEVADPLTGTGAPRVVGANGYTYHLQELAFFSWFFGGPSIGVNGWYSNNGTFLTDAGPVCESSSVAPAAVLKKGDWTFFPLK
jgi:hypothetical protein